MSPEQKLILSMKLWAFVLAGLFLFYSNKKIKFSGLSFIFVGDLAINNFFGALIYLFPWYVPTSVFIVPHYSIVQVADGFLQTSYGLFGFFLGTLMAIFFFSKAAKTKNFSQQAMPPKSSEMLVLAGIFFYVILKPLQNFASFGTLSQSGWTLLQVGVCLALWNAYQHRQRKIFIGWFLVSLTFFPLFTMVFQGFLGYAIKVVLTILCFVSLFYRKKWRLVLAAPLLLYFGLTVYVNYLDARADIRESVWGGADVAKRVDVVKRAFEHMQFFDYRNSQHLELIDLRLNQSSLVGLAVAFLEAGDRPFAHGKTIMGAFLAVIPRVLWPDKPIIGGSGSLVADYTGMTFAEGTSVGVGFPLELYANFGTVGVIMGFMVLGAVLGGYDQRAGHALYGGDLKQFLKFFFPGLALTHTAGSLSEATSSFAAAYVFLFLINKIFLDKLKRAHGKQQSKSSEPMVPHHHPTKLPLGFPKS